MPIEIDFFSRLAAPHIAASVALSLVAVLSLVFYMLPRVLPPRANKNYIERIQFIAEILVSVGLIGLVSFAGRSKIEIDAMERHTMVAKAEREVSYSYFPYPVSDCILRPEPPQPSPSAAAITDLCAIWKKFSDVGNKELDWLQASRDLNGIASREGLYPPLQANIRKISAAIDQMQEARNKAALVPLERNILTSQTSWHFLLICAFVACVGVSLKCARAAIQLWRPREPSQETPLK